MWYGSSSMDVSAKNKGVVGIRQSDNSFILWTLPEKEQEKIREVCEIFLKTIH